MELIRVIQVPTSLPSGLVVMLALGVPLVILLAILIRRVIRLEREIQADGIIVDAVVIRCENKMRDGGRTRYTPYVRYRACDGNEYEAAVNVASNLPVGRKLKIKYLPGKYDYVAFVSQEL